MTSFNLFFIVIFFIFRLTRNESEKKRRDSLNTEIGKLANIIQASKTSSRKLDKGTVLRLSVNFLTIDRGKI